FVAFGGASRARAKTARERTNNTTQEIPVGEREDAVGEREDGGRPIYEGMLAVRMLSAGEERDWWSLNEQSTIMRGERSGATLRLGDPIDVRVLRVDTSAGRVDLA